MLCPTAFKFAPVVEQQPGRQAFSALTLSACVCVQPKAAVEFDQAINYVNKIKVSFAAVAKPSMVHISEAKLDRRLARQA